MEGEHLQSPHDRLFKQTFGRVESAAAFFKAYLPAELAAAIDWQTLTPAVGSFVDETLRHQESDLLFSVQLYGRVLQLYCLFEHQSTVNRQMPFRLLKYMVRIWEQSVSGGVGTEGGLAPILPVVLYHGRQGWERSRHFTDMLALPPGLEALRRYQPTFEHLLVDLGASGLEEVRGDMIARMTLLIMRAAGRQEGREKGRQEGLDEGALIGRIQAMEDLLGLPVTAVSELGQSSRCQLESLLEALKGRLPGRS
jgi:predicted transposase YdaD